MAGLDFTNHITVQNWSKEVSLAAMDKVPFAELVGDRSSVIYRPRKLTGLEGESTTIQLRDRYRKNVKNGNVDTRLTGSVSVDYFPEKVALGQAYSSYDEGAKGQSLEAQSVAVDLADNAKEQITDDFSDWYSKAFFAQLTGTAIDGVDGFNELVKPTATVSATNVLDGVIDSIKTAKKALMNPLNGQNTASGKNWILYMSYDEEAALRKYAEANKHSWFDLATVLSIAEKSGKRLGADFLGSAYGVELRSNQYAPSGQMFLLGAQALVAQFGAGFGEQDLVHTFFDINDGTIAHFKGWTVCGVKKTQFKNNDFGTVAINISSGGTGGQSVKVKK